MNVNVNAVAYGLIDTRLTEITADANAKVNIDGREIKVGVKPAMMAVAAAPLRWAARGRRRTRPVPSTDVLA